VTEGRVKRVAHVLPFAGVGGSELSTLDCMLAAKPYGYESTAICLRDYDPLHALFRSAGIPSLAVDAPVPSYRRALRFAARSRALADEFKRLRFDLIHCQDYEAAYPAAVAGGFAGLPVLCHVRNRHPVIPMRDRPFLLPVKHFVFVSKSTWTQFDFPVAARKASVIYSGVDVVPESRLAELRQSAGELKIEMGLLKESRLVGMLARVAPQKDYETLVRAAVKVVGRHPDVRFVIVGNTKLVPDHYEHVLRLMDEAGVRNHFIFTGFLEDVSRLLGAFDIVVLSTHFEGLPQAVVEAMAYAKPIVATEVDGIPEVITHGQTGLLYPHADSDALASRLLDLLDDPSLGDRLGRSAWQAAATGLRREDAAAQMASIYDRMTA
jgi:glycosyltransferase involved in cell wall biosynthesis